MTKHFTYIALAGFLLFGIATGSASAAGNDSPAHDLIADADTQELAPFPYGRQRFIDNHGGTLLDIHGRGHRRLGSSGTNVQPFACGSGTVNINTVSGCSSGSRPTAAFLQIIGSGTAGVTITGFTPVILSAFSYDTQSNCSASTFVVFRGTRNGQAAVGSICSCSASQSGCSNANVRKLTFSASQSSDLSNFKVTSINVIVSATQGSNSNSLFSFALNGQSIGTSFSTRTAGCPSLPSVDCN
jgi:hypothetical protein